MYEKRLTQRLTSYWETLKKDDPLPLFQKFNNAAIQDVWDYCMLICVHDNGAFSYFRMGDKVRELYGGDVTGQSVNPKQRSSQNAKIIKRIADIIETPEPMYDSGQFVNDRSKVVKFRSCMLPFGQDQQVTHIIIGLSWREFG